MKGIRFSHCSKLTTLRYEYSTCLPLFILWSNVEKGLGQMLTKLAFSSFLFLYQLFLYIAMSTAVLPRLFPGPSDEGGIVCIYTHFLSHRSKGPPPWSHCPHTDAFLLTYSPDCSPPLALPEDSRSYSISYLQSSEKLITQGQWLESLFLTPSLQKLGDHFSSL